VPQHLEFVIRDTERLLLERKRQAVRDEEPDKMSRRPNRQVAKLERLGGPGPQRLLPRQVQQACPAIAQPQPRKAEGGRGCQVGQSFFRR
jgi:hypothetical protein